MADATKSPGPQPHSKEAPAPEAAVSAAETDAKIEETGEAATPDAAALAADLETLRKERDSLKDQLLRAIADMDNLRKRADRERAETAKFAIAKFAQDIVGVGDSFQHAIAAVPKDAADKDPALKSFLEGVTLAERAFLAALERHGVTQFNPVGEPFNPHQHHAASEEQNPDVPPGTVSKVYQVGYLIDERVLRPAMVVVTRGGKKPAPSTEPGTPANENAAPAAQSKAAKEAGPAASKNEDADRTE